MRALLLALLILLSSSPAFAQLILPPGPSGGGVPVGGSGTATHLARWTAGTTLGDATVTETSGALAGITTIGMSGQLTSTLATGTPPFVVASTTQVANLNAATLGGATFAAPGTIGGTTPGAATFTTLTASTSVTSPTLTTTGNLLLQTSTNNNINFNVNGANQWSMGAAVGASLFPQNDGTQDLGISNKKIRTVYVGTSIAGLSVTFANLGTPSVGTMTYCSDCDAPAAGIMATCTSAGAKTGAWAFRVNATPVWGCIGI